MEPVQNKLKINRRILAIILVLLVVVAAGGYFLYQRTKPATAPARNTTNSVVEGYKAQLASLSQAATKDPANPTTHRDYAVALYATGDPNQAYTQYQQAIKLNGSDPVLYNNLGNVARDLGKYDEAVAAYQKSISLAPTTINPYVNLANLYIYTQNKLDLGIQVYKDGLAKNPGNLDLQIQLGVAYEQAKNTTEAANTYNAILKTSPSNAAALAGLERLKQTPAQPNSTAKPSVSIAPAATPKPSPS